MDTVVCLHPVAVRKADSSIGFTTGRLGDTEPGVRSDWTRPYRHSLLGTIVLVGLFKTLESKNGSCQRRGVRCLEWEISQGRLQTAGDWEWHKTSCNILLKTKVRNSYHDVSMNTSLQDTRTVTWLTSFKRLIKAHTHTHTQTNLTPTKINSSFVPCFTNDLGFLSAVEKGSSSNKISSEKQSPIQ